MTVLTQVDLDRQIALAEEKVGEALDEYIELSYQCYDQESSWIPAEASRKYEIASDHLSHLKAARKTQRS